MKGASLPRARRPDRDRARERPRRGLRRVPGRAIPRHVRRQRRVEQARDPLQVEEARGGDVADDATRVEAARTPGGPERRPRPRQGRSHRRLPAQRLQRCRHPVDGGVRLREAARRVDREVAERPLLVDRHLRGDPRLRRGRVEPVTGLQAADLLRRRAVHDHQAVEARVLPRLHQQRRVRHRAPSALRGERRHPARLLVAHARVHDRVQAAPRGGIGEHQGPRTRRSMSPDGPRTPAPNAATTSAWADPPGAMAACAHRVEVDGAEARGLEAARARRTSRRRCRR
jgi:hypothetical protein